MDIFAGTVVQHRITRFNAVPALLVLIPPFLEDAGSLGGILSSVFVPIGAGHRHDH